MARIGYVGLGAMGGALAAHLAGPDLFVLDRNPAAVASLVAMGAKAAATLADLARDCEVIILCLPRTSDVRDALFGAGGLAEGLSPGKLVIDQTSGVPGQTAAIARDLAALGVAMLDAPVSGGVPAAKAGKVTIIASGPDMAWAQAEPILMRLSDKVLRCSDRAGDGQAMKLINNAIGGAGYRQAALELACLGRKFGFGLASMVDHLNAGPAANFTTRGMLMGVVEGRATTDFALALTLRDMNEMLALAAAVRVPMPMTAASRGIIQIGLNLLGRGARLEDVIPLAERLSDVTLRGSGGAKAALPVGLDEPAFMALFTRALTLCNALCVVEGVAAGQKYGLDMDQMVRILNAGSAWSRISETLLPALAGRTIPVLGFSMAEGVAALADLAQLGAVADVPLTLTNMALTVLQTLPAEAEAGSLVRLFGAQYYLVPG